MLIYAWINIVEMISPSKVTMFVLMFVQMLKLLNKWRAY